ncbi:unnamed protein product [Effrenium voratum]|uniref:Sodium/nucleoside cotransporter n=1 Tax=Effrenium voratum TaxID=2562239 RepID=A0AA36I289_9DINO|nr:unnamed protein product [Effrenium voratum]CAJ1427580.1 unnamed protein product [Effrenium voratum]
MHSSTGLSDVVPKHGNIEDLSPERTGPESEKSNGAAGPSDSTWLQRVQKPLLWLLVIGYLVAALCHDAQHALPAVCLAAIVGCCQLWSAFCQRTGQDLDQLLAWAVVPPRCHQPLLWGSVLALLVVVLVLAWDDWTRLIPAGGLVLLVFLTWLCSAHRCHVSWRPVITGIIIQFVFGLLIMRTSFGFTAFQRAGELATDFLSFANKGSEFVFGERYAEFFFAFKVLPVVVFFSSMVAVAYHLQLVQAVFLRLGWFTQRCMGTSYSESLVAAANIFLGQTEAPLLVKPFVAKLTQSELHAVMTSGFASIAGSVFAAYVAFGIPADHLLAASVMSCPAALAMAKLSFPETELSRTNDLQELTSDGSRNVLDALSNGAATGAVMAATIAAMLISFVSVMAFANSALEWAGSLVGIGGLTFDLVLSYLLWPLAFMMGVPPEECGKVGLLIGEKTVLNEFVAYRHLADMANAGQISRRAEIIATYALCGFSNFGAIGIQLGGLSVLAPNRKHDLAQLALRAMVTGSVACFMTGCVASILVE